MQTVFQVLQVLDCTSNDNSTHTVSNQVHLPYLQTIVFYEILYFLGQFKTTLIDILFSLLFIALGDQVIMVWK